MDAPALSEFGIRVCPSYQQLTSADDLPHNERCTDYFKRCHKFINNVINQTSGDVMLFRRCGPPNKYLFAGDILITAHAGSLDGLSRQLQGLSARPMPQFVGIVTKVRLLAMPQFVGIVTKVRLLAMPQFVGIVTKVRLLAMPQFVGIVTKVRLLAMPQFVGIVTKVRLLAMPQFVGIVTKERLLAMPQFVGIVTKVRLLAMPQFVGIVTKVTLHCWPCPSLWG